MKRTMAVGMPGTWKKNEDGEYNEQSTLIGHRRITIYSDRDGETWTMEISKSGADPWDLQAKDECAARREAIRIALFVQWYTTEKEE